VDDAHPSLDRVRYGLAPRIEAMLPAGVRTWQLTVRTLLVGMCLTQAPWKPCGQNRNRRDFPTAARRSPA
jgi:hypothetical protein